MNQIDRALVDEALMRDHAVKRSREQRRQHDIAAALLFDPLDVRYATVIGTSVSNHRTTDKSPRNLYKQNRSAALAEWRKLAA